VDWVFHAAAVSDFKPGRFCQISESGKVMGLDDFNSITKSREGKIDTRQGSFWVEMVPTDKIILRLREWFPKAKLVGWKYEVEGGLESVWQKAKEQVEKCQSDASVVNGPAFGEGFGVYWANGDRENRLENSQALAKALYSGFTPNAKSVSK
jgi:phosphopantothenoylcysteine decarboxylase/phosphopantothenate--cysteine ligase